MMKCAAACALLAMPGVVLGQVAQAGAAHVIDNFEGRALTWTAHPSDGTKMSVTPAVGRVAGSHAMRIDFAFSGGGYAIVRKELPLDLPPNYELSFWIRGDAPSENLEVKLVDSTGDNVWWCNQRDVDFPHVWRRMSIKKRQISFAWGPLGGGELRRAAALEIAVTAGSGGKGTIWLDDIVLEPRAPVQTVFAKPTVIASSSDAGLTPEAVLDGDSTTVWRPSVGDAHPTLTLDFGAPRELGGAVIDWMPSPVSTIYDIQSSNDGSAWETVYSIRRANLTLRDGRRDSRAHRDYVYLPETETRYLRFVLGSSSASGAVRQPFARAIRGITIEPIAWSESRNAFFANVARESPHGDYPKYLDGVQSYWTIIGANGDDKEALINQQGMLEVDKSAFSLAPSLIVDERYITWADAKTSASLAEGSLPIPTVMWHANDVRLGVTAFASGVAGESVLWARYRVINDAARARQVELFVGILPFQVNPPAQFLNTPGGASIIRSIASDGGIVTVVGDAKVGRKIIVPVTKPSAFGAATFDGGGIGPRLRRGVVPAESRAVDSIGAASGALAYDLEVAAHDSADVWLAVPFHSASKTPAANQTSRIANRAGEAALDRVEREWRATVGRVKITLPLSATRVTESLEANLANILIARDGPALQPGARSYERSWIRDGAMMASALLRLGHSDEARQYIEWYAPYQFSNGKVPCCVDRRGADPVPENDSHGELIYAIAEYYRYTADTAFLRRMWPHVQKAVAYIDSLRHSRMTAEYSRPEKRLYYGLVPQSISHEGYSAKPMHSYWDDAFTLRGLNDAAYLAGVLNRPERVPYSQMRDEFRRDLMASYRLAMAEHHIDYLPGSVELGDFDATSTTVSVTPGGELEALPHPALEGTFEKYYSNFSERRRSNSWNDYTPYELRVVGTLVRLGWKSRAHELLDFFFAGQRPSAWRAWAEVVHRDSTAAKFIGDLPHAWVGSDYIRSVLDMFAFERESDSALVIGAGIPAAWVSEDSGVTVKGLRTYHGALDFVMRATGDTVRTSISATKVPPGGFVVRSPFDRPIRRAFINGTASPISPDGQSVVLRARRASVVFEY